MKKPTYEELKDDNWELRNIYLAQEQWEKKWWIALAVFTLIAFAIFTFIYLNVREELSQCQADLSLIEKEKAPCFYYDSINGRWIFDNLPNGNQTTIQELSILIPFMEICEVLP